MKRFTERPDLPHGEGPVPVPVFILAEPIVAEPFSAEEAQESSEWAEDVDYN